MLFLLFFQQLVASSTHLCAKFATGTMHPAVIVLYRGVFAVCAYALWLTFRPRSIRRIERQDLGFVVLLGLINIPLNQLMFVWGLRYTSPPDASLAYALSPAFVLIISRVMHGEALRPLKIIGMSVAFVGTVIILLEKGLSIGSDHVLGNLIELCASCSWAFYTVLGRRFAIKYGAVYSTALSMFSGLILFIPLFSILPVPFLPPSALDGWQWFSVLYLGVVTSGVGFALWYYVLTKMEASKVAVFNNLQPILTTVLTIVISHQMPTLTFVLGGLVVLSGVLITQRA